MKFEKPALTVDQQVALWKSRGLQIEDEEEARHYLRFIGYYRLSGYALPLTQYHSGGSHLFKTGTTFNAILNLYRFDRELRLLVMDAIERVEVAFRTAFSNIMAVKDGPHWYLKEQNFRDRKTMEEFSIKVAEETGFDLDGSKGTKGREVFLQHYYQKYHEPKLPPCWMIIEVMSITRWSKIFEDIKHREDRKKISMEFGLNPEVLGSWMHSICYVRNLCAHHSRLWNREFTIKPLVAKGHETHLRDNTRFYAPAYVINVLMKTISPGTTWWDRLSKLIADNPFIDPRAMGFPTSSSAAPHL
jgi:abortive infection bacteriophage resistance protein